MNHLRTDQNPMFSETKTPRLAFKTKTIKPDQTRITETMWSLEFVLYERISYCPLYLADLSRQILSFYN